MNRREFALGAAVALCAPRLLAEPVPRIYGDGITDDVPGLRAAFEGRPFVTDDPHVRLIDGVVDIDGGTYAFGGTLNLSDRARGRIANSHITWTPAYQKLREQEWGRPGGWVTHRVEVR